MSKTFYSIQSLRAVAVLMVVSVHLFPETGLIGAAGVDLFFVISGFIMATIGIREPPYVFAIKRAARIIPLYWAVTLFMCALALKPGFFSQFTFDTPRLLMSLFFIPYRDVDGVIWPLVQVGWTLNFEAFFYLVFTFCLLTARPVLSAFVALCLLVVAGIVLSPQSPPLITWTSTLLFEFMFGMAIAASPRLRGAGTGVGLGALGLGILWFAVAAWSKVVPDNDGWRFLFWGGAAALVLFGALAIEEAGAWPRKVLRPLEILGDASYSFYLLHGLVIALVHKVFGTGLASAAIVLIASTIVSIISYHTFERPASRIIQSGFSRFQSAFSRS